MQRVPDAYLLNKDIPMLWNPNSNTGILQGPRSPHNQEGIVLSFTFDELKVIICLQTPNWCDLTDVNYLSTQLAPQPRVVVETHLLH